MNARIKKDFSAIRLIAGRELRDQLRDWRIIFPMLTLTLALPFLANVGAQAAINFTTQYETPLIGERLIPFLLLVVGFFPITVSLVIALESFVGEKERGTIEPLLASPLKDWQLYMGKLIAGTAAPLITSYIGISVYLIGLVAQGIAIPDANRMVQSLVLTTVQGFLMVSGAILISTQSTSVRAANLMASFVIIPMAFLIQGEAVMLFWGNDQILWLAVVGVTILTVLLARVGIAHFQREALLGREIDILNLRWAWRTFANYFSGGARTPMSWVRQNLARTIKDLMPALWITLAVGCLTVVLGYQFMQSKSDLLSGAGLSDLGEIFAIGVGIPVAGSLSFSTIFFHNLRAVLLMGLLGAFTFSTLGTLLFSVNTAVIGAVLGLTGILGYIPWRIALFGILPHGIFEILAILVSCAVVFYGSALIVTPNAKRSLGELLIEVIANWAKVMVGVVIPLLLIAAAIETWVTPVLLAKWGFAV